MTDAVVKVTLCVVQHLSIVRSEDSVRINAKALFPD